MMPNRSADILFQLIRSLEKSEKRNFKLYIQRNSGNKDLKIIELFDAMDKLEEYDENLLLRKLSSIKKPQLANVKAHLYKQLLASLRLIKTTESIDLQLHEQLDYARILYNKGLYHQSLKILEKIKELAVTYHQYSFLIQVISLEKKIETLHITRSLKTGPRNSVLKLLKLMRKGAGSPAYRTWRFSCMDGISVTGMPGMKQMRLV